MPDLRPETLRQALTLAGVPDTSVIGSTGKSIPLRRTLAGTCLGQARKSLAGSSVLVATSSQLEAAVALIDLDGFARRLVLLPPDIKAEALPSIIRDAEVDAIVCSDPSVYKGLGVEQIHRCNLGLEGAAPVLQPVRATEWLMLTSGTTGDPKLVIHTLAGLSGAIPPHDPLAPRPVWATFYDIRRYGGLQIFLRAMFSGATLVLSQADEPVAGYLARLRSFGVTHVSGTPTHWRRALMSAGRESFRPSYVRLSGEIADQAILDALKSAFPAASINHAYASTEAGVGFDVSDGAEGFPDSFLDAPRNGVEMRIVDGSLRIRSNRMASGYAGRADLELIGADGFVDTGDMIEVTAGRCRFAGRRGGIINVGGLKVHPEEIETVINSHAAVRQSRVKPRKSPILGSVVIADVVLNGHADNLDVLKQDILAHCRRMLPNHKIPALLNVVYAIEMTPGGKVSRHYA